MVAAPYPTILCALIKQVLAKMASCQDMLEPLQYSARFVEATPSTYLYSLFTFGIMSSEISPLNKSIEIALM